MSDATTVLLIDDDHHYRNYISQRLYASSLNYDVVQAVTGRAGLDLCARQPIDCVVLEIDLPDISGFEVLTKLIIVLTRFPNQFLLDVAIKNGAQAAFQKTAGIGDLLEPAILKAIATVQIRNRLVS